MEKATEENDKENIQETAHENGVKTWSKYSSAWLKTLNTVTHVLYIVTHGLYIETHDLYIVTYRCGGCTSRIEAVQKYIIVYK